MNKIPEKPTRKKLKISLRILIWCNVVFGVAGLVLLVCTYFIRMSALETAQIQLDSYSVEGLVPPVDLSGKEEELARLLEQRKHLESQRLLEDRREALSLLKDFEAQAKRVGWGLAISLFNDATVWNAPEGIERFPVSITFSKIGPVASYQNLLDLLYEFHDSPKKVELTELKVNGTPQGVTDATLEACFWIRLSHEEVASK